MVNLAFMLMPFPATEAERRRLFGCPLLNLVFFLCWLPRGSPIGRMPDGVEMKIDQQAERSLVCNREHGVRLVAGSPGQKKR